MGNAEQAVKAIGYSGSVKSYTDAVESLTEAGWSQYGSRVVEAAGDDTVIVPIEVEFWRKGTEEIVLCCYGEFGPEAYSDLVDLESDHGGLTYSEAA